MGNATVRQTIVAGFSAMILLMAALCAIADLQLRGIRTQAALIRDDSLPGLYLVGMLHAVSISTYTSVQQKVLEREPAAMEQIKAYIREKTAERLDLLKQYDHVVTSPKARELADATRKALAPYMAVRTEVERLGAN